MLFKLPPVTDVFSGITTLVVVLVITLPICIVPVLLLKDITVPDDIAPAVIPVADPLSKLNSDFSVAATL